MNRIAGATPISGGFYATRGLRDLTFVELHTLANITRWAAVGCIHENRSALAAQLMQDAAWLDGNVSARVKKMQAALGGNR